MRVRLGSLCVVQAVHSLLSLTPVVQLVVRQLFRALFLSSTDHSANKRMPRKDKLKNTDYIWQDRELRFDVSIKDLNPRPGEVLIDSINSVEDTKGNNGDRGSFRVTNLRIMWASHKNPKTNLSAGFSCIQNITIRHVDSRLRGRVQALWVMAKFKQGRFEFIFTSLVRASPRIFTTVQAVFRAYETSRLYRDLKLRGAVVKDGHLIQLPREELSSRVTGVWNLSADQGNLGTFYITNVRVVWHADLAENFNVSIPFMQMHVVSVRDSKFGPALVIETTQQSGGYILGFRIDPKERLQEILREIQSLFFTYRSNPIFGVEYTIEEEAEELEHRTVPQEEEDANIVDDEEIHDSLAAYYADPDKERDREPEFNEEIGLAVEKLPDDGSISSLSQLWLP
eukprot:gb/GECG01003545.1/.p1 GENE.gb/GECG01003545.1/~~gb/GECG01003545.1/.p1  ORF type:complete len:397 (+),score=41.16 gb/GECG01003545.1/:1-1191(+)